MRKLKADFTNSAKTKADSWYDLREDWALIESSIASQYGIRLRQASDMPWSEFVNLVTGLLPETPLGAIIKIRSEDDPNMLKQFNRDQLEIRNKWRERQALKQLDNPEILEKSMDALSNMLKSMFGENNVEVK
jgi:hypothetical protein